jgi:hypothetical protein
MPLPQTKKQRLRFRVQVKRPGFGVQGSGLKIMTGCRVQGSGNKIN